MFPDIHIFRVEEALRTLLLRPMPDRQGHFCGSAFVFARTQPETRSENGRRNSGLMQLLNAMIPFGMDPLAVMVIAFGVDHFIHQQPVFPCADGT